MARAAYSLEWTGRSFEFENFWGGTKALMAAVVKCTEAGVPQVAETRPPAPPKYKTEDKVSRVLEAGASTWSCWRESAALAFAVLPWRLSYSSIYHQASLLTQEATLASYTLLVTVLATHPLSMLKWLFICYPDGRFCIIICTLCGP